MKEYEYKVIEPDGHWGWIFASSYKKADECARDYMGEFVTVIPTGAWLRFSTSDGDGARLNAPTLKESKNRPKGKSTMKTTKYVIPEMAIQCSDRARKRRNTYIANDDARAYVMAHHELRDEIVTAQKLMYLARYELELSLALDEDVDNSNDTHYDRAFDYPIKADKHRDEAMAMLADAEIDRATYKYLIEYLYDLTTI